VRLFLNAGFGEPLGVEFLRALPARGFAGIRQDVPDPESARGLCREIAASGIQAVLLIAGGRMDSGGRAASPAEIAALARDVAALGRELGLFAGAFPSAIEIGNEPDGAVRYADDPGLFAEAVRLSRDAVREIAPGAPVIVGGISTTSRDGLGYLARAAAAGLPEDTAVGYHTYRTTQEPEAPLRGFPSRSAEFERLKQIAGRRPVWCTEAGWHTAVSYVPDGLWGLLKRKVQYTDDQVADFAEREVRINAQQGALGLVWFQLNDGPDAAGGEQRFGIRRSDGSWKPVADRLSVLGPDVAPEGPLRAAAELQRRDA
jgi:hypothetical protein